MMTNDDFIKGEFEKWWAVFNKDEKYGDDVKSIAYQAYDAGYEEGYGGAY